MTAGDSESNPACLAPSISTCGVDPHLSLSPHLTSIPPRFPKKPGLCRLQGPRRLAGRLLLRAGGGLEVGCESCFSLFVFVFRFFLGGKLRRSPPTTGSFDSYTAVSLRSTSTSTPCSLLRILSTAKTKQKTGLRPRELRIY